MIRQAETGHGGADRPAACPGLERAKLWVLIPTCNHRPLLERLLRALERQTRRDFAVVVVDDGSRDDTWEWLTGYRPGYPLLALRTDNRGPARARNLAAAMAGGPWVAFLDDDVVPDADWAAGFFAACEGDAATAVWVGRTTSWRTALPGAFTHQVRMLDLAADGTFLSCNVAVRRDVFTRVGGFDTGFPYPFLEDTDWALRCVRAGVRVRFNPAMAVDHPPRPMGWWGNLRLTRFERTRLRLVLKHRRFVHLFGASDALQWIGLALAWRVGALGWGLWGLGVLVGTTTFLAVKQYSARQALAAAGLVAAAAWAKLGFLLAGMFWPPTYDGLRPGALDPARYRLPSPDDAAVRRRHTHCPDGAGEQAR